MRCLERYNNTVKRTVQTYDATIVIVMAYDEYNRKQMPLVNMGANSIDRDNRNSNSNGLRRI